MEAVDERQDLTEDELIDDADVDTLVREAISQAVGDNQFTHAKWHQWTAAVTEGCLKRLTAAGPAKPFKYVVTCDITQKAGAGLHSVSSCRWNDKTDGKVSVQWENQSMMILATVYWLAF